MADGPPWPGNNPRDHPGMIQVTSKADATFRSSVHCRANLYVSNSSFRVQVFLGHSGGLDTEGNELPRLVYVSREKRPGFQHHKKAGAMNALVCVQNSYLVLQVSVRFAHLFMILTIVIPGQIRVSAVLTNGAYLLNVDCDHYFNSSKALREAMCFMMDPALGRKTCYVQFPQRFDGIDLHDRYANRNIVFFDVSIGGSFIGQICKYFMFLTWFPLCRLI